jgi:hypothetical protein
MEFCNRRLLRSFGSIIQLMDYVISPKTPHPGNQCMEFFDPEGTLVPGAKNSQATRETGGFLGLHLTRPFPWPTLFP